LLFLPLKTPFLFSYMIRSFLFASPSFENAVPFYPRRAAIAVFPAVLYSVLLPVSGQVGVLAAGAIDVYGDCHVSQRRLLSPLPLLSIHTF
jgi:hypothetical protein